MHTIKPIDTEIILEMNKKCKGIVTAEEHSVIGGLGSAVAEVLAGNAGQNLKEWESRINLVNLENRISFLQHMV